MVKMGMTIFMLIKVNYLGNRQEVHIMVPLIWFVLSFDRSVEQLTTRSHQTVNQ